jgi:hypothetical protein
MRLERQVAVAHVIGSSAYRRRTALVTTQVLLWRALAVGFVAFALARFVTHERMHTCCGGSKADLTALTVRKFAYEAFPQWATVHHMDSCPESLNELTGYASTSRPIDAWGNPLEMKCGPWIRGIYVRSAGEDGRFETPDDITSNDG